MEARVADDGSCVVAEIMQIPLTAFEIFSLWKFSERSIQNGFINLPHYFFDLCYFLIIKHKLITLKKYAN